MYNRRLYKFNKTTIEEQTIGRLRKEQILKITSPCLDKAVYSCSKVKQRGEIHRNCISLTKQFESDFERDLYTPICIKDDFIKNRLT